MSNLLVAEDTPPHKYRVAAPAAAVPALVKPEVPIKGWLIDILVLVVGLLALFFFVALGEAFAVVGPWLIFTGVSSIRKRPGSGRQLLRIVTGVGLLCLSAAVFLLPHHAGSGVSLVAYWACLQDRVTWQQHALLCARCANRFLDVYA